MNYISDILMEICTREYKGKLFFINKKNLYFKGEVLCVCMFSVCDV